MVTDMARAQTSWHLGDTWGDRYVQGADVLAPRGHQYVPATSVLPPWGHPSPEGVPCRDPAGAIACPRCPLAPPPPRSDCAILYNDRSVLENHHISAVFRMMQDEEMNIFVNLTKDEFA